MRKHVLTAFAISVVALLAFGCGQQTASAPEPAASPDRAPESATADKADTADASEEVAQTEEKPESQEMPPPRHGPSLLDAVFCLIVQLVNIWLPPSEQQMPAPSYPVLSPTVQSAIAR